MIYGDLKELAKDLWTLAKGTQNADLVAKTLDMRERMNELIEASQEKDERIRQLESLVGFQGTLVFSDAVYWSADDATPYCPLCWEKDKRAIHLIMHSNDYKDCPACKNGWGPRPSSPGLIGGF